MTLLADLEAFVRDHGSHGEVSGDATACDRSGVSSLFAGCRPRARNNPHGAARMGHDRVASSPFCVGRSGLSQASHIPPEPKSADSIKGHTRGRRPPRSFLRMIQPPVAICCCSSTRRWRARTSWLLRMVCLQRAQRSTLCWRRRSHVLQVKAVTVVARSIPGEPNPDGFISVKNFTADAVRLSHRCGR
jgi:hypothetical protein